MFAAMKRKWTKRSALRCKEQSTLVKRTPLPLGPLGIQRTFVAREGNAKAPVEPAKMMLGPRRRGAARLGPPGDLLMIGEGFETCLAAMQASGHPA